MPGLRPSSPSWLPAGTSITTSLAESVRPVPPQAWQGSATTLPVPSHSGQVIIMTPKSPVSTVMWPAPPQVGQVSGWSASTEPDPWQTPQGA